MSNFIRNRCVYDEWLREERCYFDVSFPTRQRHVNILDASFFLKGIDGDNKSFLCPIAATINLFNAKFRQINVILILSLCICCDDVFNA